MPRKNGPRMTECSARVFFLKICAAFAQRSNVVKLSARMLSAPTSAGTRGLGAGGCLRRNGKHKGQERADAAYNPQRRDDGPPLNSHGFGHTAPLVTQASTSAPACFCVPGAGLRPAPGAHAQPTRWSSPICSTRLASDRLPLRAGSLIWAQISPIVLPSQAISRGARCQIGFPARAGLEVRPPDGRSDIASPEGRSRRRPVRPEADAVAPCRPGAGGRQRDGN